MSVQFALSKLLQNHAFPSKWTALDAMDAMCMIEPRVFAKHPRLRMVCLMKILQLRHDPRSDMDVLDRLERFRVVLHQCVHQDIWVADADFDDEFRTHVSNPDLVWDDRDTVSLCDAIQTAYLSDSDEESLSESD